MAETDNAQSLVSRRSDRRQAQQQAQSNQPNELSMADVGTFVAEATPVIGDAMAAKQVYDELQKEEPDYALVGALGGAALIGLIPGIGDAAAIAIRRGARRMLGSADEVAGATRSIDAGISDETILEADELIFSWEKGEMSNAELRRAMRERGLEIQNRQIRPNMNGNDLEVAVPSTGEVVKWQDMPRGFAKGGEVRTNKQMEFLFEEGGIADDGMDRDPVSGNEVPAGSLAEEVRDDIPAQLSEGEYVVPADVVRFYGVKYFEDLREEAKEGLGEMEREGRIGGEPVDMEGDDTDLTPEEMAELESIMGMAVGGYVEPAPQAIGNTGYMQSQARQGYSVGGNVTESDTQVNLGTSVPVSGTQVQFSEQQFPQGFSLRSTPRSVAYVQNGEGETKFFILPDQQALYDLAISQGFRDTTAGVVPPEVVAEAGQTLQQVEQQDSGGGGGGFTTMGGGEPRDFSSMTTEELYSNLNGVNTMGKIGGALAIAVNPIFAIAMRGAFNASRLNIVQELEARGEDMSQFREDNGRDLYGGGLGLYDGLQDTNNDGETNFGDTWFGDLLGFDGQAGVQGPGLRDSRDGARRDFTPTVTRTASAPAAEPAATQQASTTTTPSSTYDPVGTGSEGGGGDNGGGYSPPSRQEAQDSVASQQERSGGRGGDMTGGANLDTAYGISGLKEGGFVSRRKKKNK